MDEKKFSQVNLTYIIIAVIIAIAILGFGGLNYISSERNRQIEQMKLQQEQQQTQQQQEQKTQQLEQAKQKQSQKKQALDKCLLDAANNYSENWYSECKAQGLMSEKCITLHDMTFDEYAKQNNIPSITENYDKYFAARLDFQKQQADCSCRLPQYNADLNDKRLQNDKDLCTKLYGTQ